MKDASEIDGLDGLEAVRRRSAIYLGALDDPLLATRLLLEARLMTELRTCRNAKQHVLGPETGKPTTALERHERTDRHGTCFALVLDRTILSSVEFSTAWLREWLGGNAGALRFDVTDRRTGESFTVSASADPVN